MTEESPSAARPKRSRVLGCLLVSGALLLVLILAPLAVYFAWSARASRLVEAELAELREAGEPIDAADLEAFYARPTEEEDCTRLWLDATAALDTQEFLDTYEELTIKDEMNKDIPPPGKPWPDLPAAETFLEGYPHSLALLHQAAERGGAARYPLDFSKGLAMETNHVQWLRNAVRLLSLEAHVLAHRGDPHGAAESIRTIHAVAASLERQPLLVSQLVRFHCDGIAHEVLCDLLPHVEFSEDDLKGLQAELLVIDYGPGLRRAVMGERAVGIELFRNPSPVADSGELKPLTLIGPRNDDLLLYLDFMGRTVAATRLTGPTKLDAAEKIQDDIRALVAGSNAINQVRYAFTGLLMPAVTGVFEAEAEATADNRIAAAAIAVERYRRRHGRLPKKLEDLVPDLLPQVPKDPFDGQPLRYVVRDGEVVIYSIGRNRIDDGGDEGDEEEIPPDVVLRLPL